MQVHFNINRAEWREARALHRARGNRSVGQTWAWMLVAVPLIGAVADLVRVAGTSHMTLRGTLAPELFLLAAVVAAAFSIAGRARENRAASSVSFDQIWTVTLGEDGLTREPMQPASSSAKSTHHAWREFTETQVGTDVLVLPLAKSTDYETLPLRAFSEDQQGRLHRLLARKIRPQREEEEPRAEEEQPGHVRESVAPLLTPPLLPTAVAVASVASAQPTEATVATDAEQGEVILVSAGAFGTFAVRPRGK